MINRNYYAYVRKSNSNEWFTSLYTYKSFFADPQKVCYEIFEDAKKIWNCQDNEVIIKSFVRV